MIVNRKFVFMARRIFKRLRWLPFLATAIYTTFPLFAQDSNLPHPIEDIERMLSYDPVEITFFRDIRFEGDKAKTAILKRDDGFFVRAKFKRAAVGGEAFNNQPRYEIAAYKLQTLFLKPENYVVPPTVGRGFPLHMYQELDRHAQPTFKKSSEVFCVVQYWLNEVTTYDIFDKKRFNSDSLYAKYLGNLNIFTYLVKHDDPNIGNILISTDPSNPRVFAVDNGVAFGDFKRDPGSIWRSIRLKRLPKETLDRLRQIKYEDLTGMLSVVAQYIVVNGQLMRMEPTSNLDHRRGVRKSAGIIQFGLTKSEIDGIHHRLKALLFQVDSGKIETF
jgi:hypothetical protein